MWRLVTKERGIAGRNKCVATLIEINDESHWKSNLMNFQAIRSLGQWATHFMYSHARCFNHRRKLGPDRQWSSPALQLVLPVEFPHLAWQHDDNLISQQGKGKQNKKHKLAKTDGAKKPPPVVDRKIYLSEVCINDLWKKTGKSKTWGLSGMAGGQMMLLWISDRKYSKSDPTPGSGLQGGFASNFKSESATKSKQPSCSTALNRNKH